MFTPLPGSLPCRQMDLHVCVPVRLLCLMQNRHQAMSAVRKRHDSRTIEHQLQGLRKRTLDRLFRFLLENKPISTSAGPKPESQIKEE